MQYLYKLGIRYAVDVQTKVKEQVTETVRGSEYNCEEYGSGHLYI